MAPTADLPDLNAWLALTGPAHIHHQHAVHDWEPQAAALQSSNGLGNRRWLFGEIPIGGQGRVDHPPPAGRAGGDLEAHRLIVGIQAAPDQQDPLLVLQAPGQAVRPEDAMSDRQ